VEALLLRKVWPDAQASVISFSVLVGLNIPAYSVWSVLHVSRYMVTSSLMRPLS
jgi:hypothetical protein